MICNQNNAGFFAIAWQRVKRWLYTGACMAEGCVGRVRILDGSRFNLAARRECVYCETCLDRLGVGRWRDEP